MKILYLSVHSILEHDEVSLFHELGYEVFSPGAYVEPRNPGDTSLRPGIEGLVYDPYIVDLWNKHEQKHPELNGKDYIFETPEIIEYFDCIIVMHMPSFITNNWEAMKHKRVIWRTIGQSIVSTEQQLKKMRHEGMEIVRYSPMEAIGIPGFIGQDALIRFYKDPDEYCNWNGENKRVITFSQHMRERAQACSYDLFEYTTRIFNRHLFGPGNEGMDWSTGKVSHERMIQELQNNRTYFYTGTHPASYTLNFMEAAMTGIPLVCIGSGYGNASYFPNHNLYEIPNLVEHGVSGFISDDVNELRSYIQLLLEDDAVAKLISEGGRKMAIHHFGKSMIGAAWKDYLDNGPRK